MSSNNNDTAATATGRLSGEIVIVTGGLRGFGASIVTLFVSQGARVLTLDLLVQNPGFYDCYSIEQPPSHSSSSSNNDAQAKGPSESSYALKADVTCRSDWETALKTCIEVFGSNPTCVVNNAGWTYSNKPTLQVSEQEFDRVFDINVKSVFLSVDVILPALLQQTKTSTSTSGASGRRGKGANFINISSTAALRPRPGLVWYNASKGAVSTATKALAVEYASQGIRFNSVCPVAGNTPLLSKFAGSKEAGDEMDATVLEKFAASIPIGRLSEGRDIANACLFLADPASDFITGIEIAVDGGRCV